MINMNKYECSFCGKKGVKLWRTSRKIKPLICATCAEECQSCLEYEEMIWKHEGEYYSGKQTGKMLPLPKWKVNEKGKVPSYDGPGPEGCLPIMTEVLVVDLSVFAESCNEIEKLKEESVIPAYPDWNDGFIEYTSASEEVCKWWENLPTRKEN